MEARSKAIPADPHFVVGKPVHIAIHSIALTFAAVGLAGAEEVIGQRFDLTLERETSGGKTRYSSLTLVKLLPKDKPSK